MACCLTVLACPR